MSSLSRLLSTNGRSSISNTVTSISNTVDRTATVIKRLISRNIQQKETKFSHSLHIQQPITKHKSFSSLAQQKYVELQNQHSTSLFVQNRTQLQKRGFLDVLSTIHPITLKILLGTAVAGSYVAYLTYIRAEFKQRQYIFRKLTTPANLINPPIALNRKNEQKILIKYFNSPPSGPSVIIGPESAGKGAMLKNVFKDRKMLLWMDLKQNPVTTGEEFIVQFINTSGYLLPQSSSLWTSLIGIGGAKSRKDEGHTPQEIDLALTAIADILKAEKEQGWPNGVPVICLDDIHRIGTCNDLDLVLGNAKVSDDRNFLKFMDWCVHVSDNKLAHIVFVTSYAFAHLDLDTHAGFRRRRSLICIDYAEPDVVKSYLNQLPERYEQFQKKPLSPEAVDNIAGCVGGQVEDLDRVVTGLFRGDTYYNILRTMLTDSICEIEDHLEAILEQASKTNDEQAKQQVFDKYLRFWNLMEILHKDRHVNKRWIVVNVFKHQHTEELERLLATGMISFVNERFPDTIGKKPDTIFSLLNSSLDSIALTAGSPKLQMAFGLLLRDEKMLKQREWVQLQTELRSLRDREKEHSNVRKQLMEEYSQRLAQLEKLVTSEDKWVAALGRDDVQRRKHQIVDSEIQLHSRIEEENNALATIRSELSTKLTAQ